MRRELERRVDELAEVHSGEEFAGAVRRYSETLDDEGREELKLVLLERARLLESALGERVRARGWLSRLLEPLEQLERRRSPPGNRRAR